MVHKLKIDSPEKEPALRPVLGPISAPEDGCGSFFQ